VLGNWLWSWQLCVPGTSRQQQLIHLCLWFLETGGRYGQGKRTGTKKIHTHTHTH
jgi:hypothetical protein